MPAIPAGVSDFEKSLLGDLQKNRNVATDRSFAAGGSGGGSSQKWSNYDDGINISQQSDYQMATQEARARRQPLSEKAMNGLTKAGSSAVASLVGSVAAPIDWSIAGLSSDYDLSNAPIGTALAKWSDKVGENNPHYYSQHEQDADALSAANLFSANFVTDKVLSGIGFLAGAAAGAYLTGGIGAFAAEGTAGAVAKGLPRLAQIFEGSAVGGKLAKLAISAENHVAALEEISTALKTGDQAAAKAALDKAVSSIKIQTRAQQMYATAASTHGEAIMEAMGSHQEVTQQLTDKKLGEKKSQQQQMIASILAMNPNASREQLDAMLTQAGLSDANVSMLTETESADIEAVAGSTRQAVYLGNVAVLSASNFGQLRSLLSRGYGDLLADEAKGIWKPMLVGEGKYALNAPKWFQKAAYGAGQAVQHALPEMAEEGAQTLMQKTAGATGADMLATIEHRRSALGHQANPDAAKAIREDVVGLFNTTQNMMGNLAPTFKKELADKEFQESIMLGGLIGVLGDAGHKVLSGNKAAAAQKAQAQAAVEFMNQYGRTGEFAEKTRSLVRHLSNEMDADAAVKNRNPAAYDEARNNQLRDLVLAAKKSGRMSDLRDSIKAWQAIAQEEDKTGNTPAGEVKVSAQGMDQLMQRVDELDALHDQVGIAYGRAFKGGKTNVDAAFESVASSHLRQKSLDELSNQVALQTKGSSGETGYDLKGFLAGRPQNAVVSSKEIEDSVNEFAASRNMLAGDPAIVSLRSDIEHAVKLRQATAQDNETLLSINQGSLGNRLDILHSTLEQYPAMMPQYRSVLRDKQQPIGPPGTLANAMANQAATSATPASSATSAIPATPATAAGTPAPPTGTPATAGLPDARAAVLASIIPNPNVSGQFSINPQVAASTGINLPAFIGNSAQEVEQQVNDFFDEADAEDAQAEKERLLRDAQEGNPSGDDTNTVNGDTNRVGDITDTGEDADAYYASIPSVAAENSAELTDEDGQAGVAGLPIVASAPNADFEFGEGGNQLSAAQIKALNDGTDTLIMTSRPATVTSEGVVSYEFAVRKPDGSLGMRMEVPLERLRESPGADEMIAAHDALLDRQLGDDMTQGVPVKTHTMIMMGNNTDNVQQVGSRLPISQQDVLFDEHAAAVVRISVDPTGSISAQPMWGVLNGERQQVADAMVASGNVVAGDYLVHSVLRQDGAPAVLPMQYGTGVVNMQNFVNTTLSGIDATTAVYSVVERAQTTLGLPQVKWDGKSLHVGDSAFSFDDTGWGKGERDLDKLFVARPTEAAVQQQAATAADNAALAELQQRAQALSQGTAEAAPATFTATLSEAMRLAPVQPGPDQLQQFREATINWNPQNSSVGVRILSPTTEVMRRMAAPLNEPDSDEVAGEGESVATPEGSSLTDLRRDVLSILPEGVTLGEVEGVHRRLALTGSVLGTILGPAIRVLTGRSYSRQVAWHEAYHVAHRYVFTNEERDQAEGYAASQVPRDSIDFEAIRLSRPFLENETDDFIYNYELEEWLADRFADHMLAREANGKPKGFLARLWDKLFGRLQTLDSPEVQRLFEALGKGEFKSRELQPMFSEIGAPVDVRDIALAYVPEARTLQAQESSVQALLAYFINAKYHRLGVNPVSAATGKEKTFFLPSLSQLTADFNANTQQNIEVGQLSDQQLIEAIMHRRKQEDTVRIPIGLEGEALQKYLDDNALYLPNPSTEWSLNGQLPITGRAYKQLYNSASAKRTLAGELLLRERTMQAAQLIGDEAGDDNQASEASERNYDAGPLEGGARLPARLQLYLSTIVYREPQEDGGPLVVRSVDATTVMRRLRTIANIVTLNKAVGSGTSESFPRGSLADFLQKVYSMAAAGQGTKEGAMLNAVAARLRHDFGFPNRVADKQSQGLHDELSNLSLVFNEANQRRMPAVIAQRQEDGTVKILSAQRRPLWTEVMSTGSQIWTALNQRERKANAQSALAAVAGLRQKIAAWTAEYSASAEKKVVTRTDLLREIKKVRASMGRMGLVLPEEFLLAAVTGSDPAYDVRVRADRNAPALPLPAISTTKLVDDDGNTLENQRAQKSKFKEALETSRSKRNDLLDDLQAIAEAVAANGDSNPFSPGFVAKEDNETPTQTAFRVSRLKARNMAQAAADYDAAAMENMWLDANGSKQRSYSQPSYLIETAASLEAGLLTSDSTDPLPFMRSEYEKQADPKSVQWVKAQQEKILAGFGRYGTWMRTNWLVRNHTTGFASIAALRYFYDGGVFVKHDAGQIGQTSTDLSERDALTARLARFQNGLVTANLLEASKLSLLVQHSEHTGDESWVDDDEKNGKLRLNDMGLSVVTQQVAGMAVHMNAVLHELYGDEQGRDPLHPSERVANLHGRLPMDGSPIPLPYKKVDADGNPTLAKDGTDALDENGKPVELTRDELRTLLYNTNDYSSLPRGLQPLELPVLQGAEVMGEEGERVPLTLAMLLNGPATVNGVGVESEMLREVVEGNLNEQYDNMRKRLGQYGINEGTLATLRAMSGQDQNKVQFSVSASKEKALSGNQTSYQTTPQFLGDFLYKSQMFRDAYGQLTRGHEGYFASSTDVTKRAKGMGGFGPHMGEGNAKIAVIPTINEMLDQRTLLPASEETPSEFIQKVDGTDAQGYITTGRLLEYLAKLWNLGEHDLRLIEKACYGEELTEKEYARIGGMLHEASAGPIKNMIYGMVAREGGMRNPLYVKTSVLPLIPAFTSQRVMAAEGLRWVARPGLEWYHDLRLRMERQNVDEAFHTTAVKAGGTQLSSNVHSDDLLTHEVANRDVRRQQVVPAGKEEIIGGSQLLALLDGNISEAANVVVGGVETTVGQLRTAYNQLHADARAWQLNRAKGLYERSLDGKNLLWALVESQQRDQGMDEGTLEFMAQQVSGLVFNPNLPAVEGTMLSSMLNFLGKQSLRYKVQGGKYTLASSAGMRIYDMLDEAGNVVGVMNPFDTRRAEEYGVSGHWTGDATHPNGQPRYGEARALKMHNPTYTEGDVLVPLGEARGWRFLQGLGAHLGQDANPAIKSMQDQGLLGALLQELDLNPAQASAAGLLAALQQKEGKDEQPIKVRTISVAQRAALEGALSKLPDEPVSIGKQVQSVQYAECIISGDFLLHHGLQPSDLMNPDKVSPEVREQLMEMLGYRIPTQAHQSMIPLKVVGIAPPIMGSVIFCPSGLTYVSGADFDIDALYTKRLATWMDQGGRLQIYGQADTAQQQEKEYRQAVKADKFYKKVLPYALREVRRNMQGVFDRLAAKQVVTSFTSEGVAVMGNALPKQVLDNLRDAVKLGGFENLQKLRDNAKGIVKQYESLFGSFNRISQLAAIERLERKKQKNKAEALRQKFAEQLFPQEDKAVARKQFDEQMKALRDSIGQYEYAVEGQATRKLNASHIVQEVQASTELMRTAMEAENQVEDKEASDNTELSGKASSLEKVLAHYLALNTLNLPMTGWEASVTETDTQQSISNRLLKTELAIVTAPALWDQLSMSTSVDELVDMSRDMRDFFQMDGGTDAAYNGEGTQLDQRTATYAGRENIGFSAYMNAVLSYASKLGLRVKRGGLKMGERTLTSFAVQEENDLTYSIEKSNDGPTIKLGDGRIRLKSQSMTNHMSMDTDNAKYQAAKFLNFNEFTSAGIMTLLNFGWGEKRTGLFMMQPVLRAMSEYRIRQENSIERSLDDPRDFGKRLGDLETLVQELLLQRSGKNVASLNVHDRRAAALMAAGFAAPSKEDTAAVYKGQGRKGRGVVARFKNGQSVDDFSDRAIVESLNRRNLGTALMNSLLSSRLPTLVGQDIIANTGEIENLLDANNIRTDQEVKAFYAYIVQQRAFNDKFNDLNDVTNDLYDLSAVTSLVKGQMSSEADVLRPARVIKKVEGNMFRSGLRHIENGNGSAFSFNKTPLMKQLTQTAKFLKQTATDTFLRFNEVARSVLDPILDTVDAAGTKTELRERLTTEMLTALTAQYAVQERLIQPGVLNQQRALLTHPTENIVTKLRQTLAANPSLATNPLLKKLEEQVPGKGGALYWGLRANFVGLEGNELTRLRDGFSALRLHQAADVREFAASLEQYVLTADGPTASSTSLASILPAASLTVYSSALNRMHNEFDRFEEEAKADNLPANIQRLLNDVTNRLLSRPDVRSQVAARPQFHGLMNYLTGIVQQNLDNEAIDASDREVMRQDINKAGELEQDRGGTVTVMSPTIFQYGLRAVSPAIGKTLDDISELMKQVDQASGRPMYEVRKLDFEARRSVLEEQLRQLINTEMGLTDSKDQIRQVSIYPKKPKDFQAPSPMSLTIWDMPKGVSTVLRLPSALRLSPGEEKGNDGDPTQAEDGSLNSARFAAPTTTSLAVALREGGATFFVENNLAISNQLPQQPHLSFSELTDELRAREQDLADLGEDLKSSGQDFMDRMGDNEAGVATAKNDEALLQLLMQNKTPEQQQRLEVAASVLMNVYGRNLEHLPYPAQVAAVDDQLNDKGAIHCEL
jgi:hypothetical protein